MDPIALAAAGMANALRQRCIGCLAGLPVLEGDSSAFHIVTIPGEAGVTNIAERQRCSLEKHERLALAAYMKAVKG